MLVTCTWWGKWITAMWLDIWISNQWEVITKLKLFNCNCNDVGKLLHCRQYYYYCSNMERPYSNIIACSQRTHRWTEVAAGVRRDWMLRQNPSGGWKNFLHVVSVHHYSQQGCSKNTWRHLQLFLLWPKYLKPNLWCFPEREQSISYPKTRNIQFGLQRHGCQTFILEIGSHKQNLVGVRKRSGLTSRRLVQNTLHVLT